MILAVIIGLVVAVSVLGTIVIMNESKTPQEKMAEAIVESFENTQTESSQTLQAINDPLKACINDRDTPYKFKATLELIIDGNEVVIPANINSGRDGECQRTLYTISNDGTIHAEWVQEYPFEIGHFLWMWDFPLKDMERSESRLFVDGVESDYFINHPLQDGSHYKFEMKTKP